MNADEIVRTLQERAKDSNRRGFSGEASELMEIAALIKSLQAQHKQAALNYQQKCRDVVELEAQLAASQRRAQDARNELCQKCGQYREAHNGACNGCRWKE